MICDSGWFASKSLLTWISHCQWMWEFLAIMGNESTWYHSSNLWLQHLNKVFACKVSRVTPLGLCSISWHWLTINLHIQAWQGEGRLKSRWPVLMPGVESSGLPVLASTSVKMHPPLMTMTESIDWNRTAASIFGYFSNSIKDFHLSQWKLAGLGFKVWVDAVGSMRISG